MDSHTFNEKYKPYLKKGYSGLSFSIPIMVNYLDKEFEELIKIPGFLYTQIKGKFNWFCFYGENIPEEKRIEIETKLKELYENSI